MTRNRRRPARRAHPDPVIENELQRIESLRVRVGLLGGLAEDYRLEMRKLHDHIRQLRNMSHDQETVTSALEQVPLLQVQIRQLSADANELHDEIAKRIAVLSPSDLAFLQ